MSDGTTPIHALAWKVFAASKWAVIVPPAVAVAGESIQTRPSPDAGASTRVLVAAWVANIRSAALAAE